MQDLCRFLVAKARGFSHLSPSKNTLQNTSCQKASILLKLFYFQHTNFQEILKTCYRCSSFFYTSATSKKAKLILELTQANSYALHMFLCCDSTQAEFLQVNYNLWRKRGFLFGALMQLSLKGPNSIAVPSTLYS